MMIAVLTGDLVHSTKMQSNTYDAVIRLLQTQLDSAYTHCKAIGDIYRGDAFQIQYPTPTQAIKSALQIKLALHLSDISTKPIKCTLSLAYGDYDTYSLKPNTSSGPVYVDSGRGLEKTSRGDISIHIQQEHPPTEFTLLTQFLNHQLNRLTKTQAELLYQYLEHDFSDHQTMAALTGTTRQNISNRLSNIGAHLVRDYVKTLNNHIEQIQLNSKD